MKFYENLFDNSWWEEEIYFFAIFNKIRIIAAMLCNKEPISNIKQV